VESQDVSLCYEQVRPCWSPALQTDPSPLLASFQRSVQSQAAVSAAGRRSSTSRRGSRGVSPPAERSAEICVELPDDLSPSQRAGGAPSSFGSFDTSSVGSRSTAIAPTLPLLDERRHRHTSARWKRRARHRPAYSRPRRAPASSGPCRIASVASATRLQRGGRPAEVLASPSAGQRVERAEARAMTRSSGECLPTQGGVSGARLPGRTSPLGVNTFRRRQSTVPHSTRASGDAPSTAHEIGAVGARRSDRRAGRRA